jgi:hypothetical protein
MISSPLMTGSYERRVPDYTAHNDREIPMAQEPEWAEETDRTQETDPTPETDRAQLDSSLGSPS